MLELAKREGAGPATIVEIAHSQQIPARFLESILRQLKQAGYTESVRGKKGGYVLAVPANRITVGEIIRLIEGPFFATDNSSGNDVFNEIWGRAEAALVEVYDSVHFRRLAERQAELSRQFVADYTI